MTPDESKFFALLDEYSRTCHHCFVAEMNRGSTTYSMCFRPTKGNEDSPGRYACRYLEFDAAEVRAAGETRMLSTEVRNKLDSELPLLSQPTG
jgi:hypothetical protein